MNKKDHFTGCYDTPEQAAEAVSELRKKLHAEFAADHRMSA